MRTRRSILTHEWCELVGDGALISAGTMSLLTGIVLLVTGVMIKGSVPVWMQITSAILVPLAGLAGPVVTWLVHERPITLVAVGGALLSGVVTGALFFAFVLLSTGLGWLLQGVNDAEWFGPLVGVTLVACAFLAVCAWLVVDAVRDHRPSARQHPRVDSVRLASAAIVVVFSAVVVTYSLKPGGGETVEALAFMLMGALSGACAVGLADLAQRVVPRKTGDAPVASA